jgi:hypothetical protein
LILPPAVLRGAVEAGAAWKNVVNRATCRGSSPPTFGRSLTMGAYSNKMKVTLTQVNAPVLIALGSLVPGAGGTIEKLLTAASRSNGLATTGKGRIEDQRLIFIGDNVASWMLGARTILNIPIKQISAMYIGNTFLGGYFFTLDYGGTRTDMCAIYGGRAFRDQLATEIRAAGGSVY